MWFAKGGREKGGGQGQEGKSFAFSDWRSNTSIRKSCLDCTEVRNFGRRRPCHFGIRTMEARRPGWSKDVSESDSSGLVSQHDRLSAKGHGGQAKDKNPSLGERW